MKKTIAILLYFAILLSLALISACKGGGGTFVITMSSENTNPATTATNLTTLPATLPTGQTGPAVSTTLPTILPPTLSIGPATLPPPDGTISIQTEVTTTKPTTKPPTIYTTEAPPTITAVAPAGQVSFSALLTGEAESPAVPTATVGRLRITFNAERTQALFELTVNGGTGISDAQLRLAEEGASGPVVVTLFNRPAGVNITGTLASGALTNTSLSGPLNSLAVLANAMAQGDIYVEIHSLSNPGGLIRGQLDASAAPVTATVPVTFT